MKSKHYLIDVDGVREMKKYEVLAVFKHEGQQMSASIVLRAENKDKAGYIVEYQLFPYKNIEIVEVKEL